MLQNAQCTEFQQQQCLNQIICPLFYAELHQLFEHFYRAKEICKLLSLTQLNHQNLCSVSLKNIGQFIKIVINISLLLQSHLDDEQRLLPLDQRALVYAFNKCLCSNTDCQIQQQLCQLVSDNKINYQVASQLARNNLLLQLVLSVISDPQLTIKAQQLQNQLLTLSTLLNTTIIDESQLLTRIIQNNLFLNIKSQNNTPELYSENFLSTLNAFLEGNKCRKVTNAAEYVNELINFSQKEENIEKQTVIFCKEEESVYRKRKWGIVAVLMGTVVLVMRVQKRLAQN
ncbi:Hypothetical_protein [Hexamita inflata]|uniref:Hypothetical_protein n=1 Tax=Hexamita inflata TaxID=28002 RepID=A0AA86N7L7_9EUKA|nr:Hypothetical protein HINF_LOCUS1564 [Hexamita inflata]